MDFKVWQAEFDEKKWVDSIIAGEDRCGTYEFCVKCKKAESEPCARAKYRYDNPYTRLAVIHRRSKMKETGENIE